MNNTIDLLNLSEYGNVKLRSISSTNELSSSNKTFADVLNAQQSSNNINKKNINSKDYNSLNDATILNITDIASSKKGQEFLNKLNSLLSDDSIESNTELKSSIKNIIENINDAFAKLEDASLGLEEKSEISEEALQSLIAMLDGFMNIAQNIITTDDQNLSLIVDNTMLSSSSETLELYLDGNIYISDIENIGDTEDFSNIIQSIDNIAEKISTLFGENSELNDFMGKLSYMISLQNEQDSEVDSNIDLTKKEDIGENLNNLDMKPILNSNIDAVNVDFDNIDTLHPVAKQILHTIQSQLGAVNLDGKTVEVRLKLYPSKLGEISVVIGRSGDNINVNISSDNADVRRLLSDSTNILKNNLSEANSGNISIDISNGNSNNENRNKKNNTTIDTTDTLNKYVEEATLKLEISNTLTNKILDIKL